MPRFPDKIIYSDKYCDDEYEYRHIILTCDLYERVKRIGRLLKEKEFRSLGIKVSSGWDNYSFFKPEPHILMLRKKIK